MIYEVERIQTTTVEADDEQSAYLIAYAMPDGWETVSLEVYPAPTHPETGELLPQIELDTLL